MFVLFHLLIVIGLTVVDSMAGTFDGESGYGLFSSVYTLAVFLPGLAVFVRRLHDTNRSGWWLLFGLVPLVGAIVLFIFTVQDSQADANRFGPNPKA